MFFEDDKKYVYLQPLSKNKPVSKELWECKPSDNMNLKQAEKKLSIVLKLQDFVIKFARELPAKVRNSEHVEHLVNGGS